MSNRHPHSIPTVDELASVVPVHALGWAWADMHSRGYWSLILGIIEDYVNASGVLDDYHDAHIDAYIADAYGTIAMTLHVPSAGEEIYYSGQCPDSLHGIAQTIDTICAYYHDARASIDEKYDGQAAALLRDLRQAADTIDQHPADWLVWYRTSQGLYTDMDDVPANLRSMMSRNTRARYLPDDLGTALGISLCDEMDVLQDPEYVSYAMDGDDVMTLTSWYYRDGEPETVTLDGWRMDETRALQLIVDQQAQLATTTAG